MCLFDAIFSRLVLKIVGKSATIFLMKTLYDVQQLLKRYGIVVYMGNRLYDIEMMKLELSQIYQAGILDRTEYLEAEIVLRREHRLEEEYQRKRGEKE